MPWNAEPRRTSSGALHCRKRRGSTTHSERSVRSVSTTVGTVSKWWFNCTWSSAHGVNFIKQSKLPGRGVRCAPSVLTT